MNFIIKRIDMEEFLNNLTRNFDVFVPIKKDKNYFYQDFKPGMKIDLDDYQNTLYSPKKFFYPFKENIFTYNKGKFKTNLKNKRKKVIFGIRPCDMHGILILNKVFSKFYQDVYHFEKKKAVISIVINCDKAGEHCFCGSFGTNVIKEGFDLIMTRDGDDYIVETGSKKGKRLIDKNMNFFAKTDKKPNHIELKYKRKIKSRNIVNLLKNNFDHPIWDEEAKKCISCAACTITCPTCHCFDVNDVINFNDAKIDRVRTWDSCQIKDFTRIFGNFDVRGDRASRLKHRILCKLNYFMERYGLFGCTGCGRCIESCLEKIDMTEIINKIGESEK